MNLFQIVLLYLGLLLRCPRNKILNLPRGPAVSQGGHGRYSLNCSERPFVWLTGKLGHYIFSLGVLKSRFAVTCSASSFDYVFLTVPSIWSLLRSYFLFEPHLSFIDNNFQSHQSFLFISQSLSLLSQFTVTRKKKWGSIFNTLLVHQPVH